MLFQNPHFKPELCGEDNDNTIVRDQTGKADPSTNSLERRSLGSTGVFEKNAFNPSPYQPRSTLNAPTVKNLISRYEDLKKASSQLGITGNNNWEPAENEGHVKRAVTRIEENVVKKYMESPNKHNSSLFNKNPDPKSFEENFFDDMSILDSSLNSSVNTMNDLDRKKEFFDNPFRAVNKSDISLRNASRMETSQRGDIKYDEFKRIETEDILSETDHSQSFSHIICSGALKFDRVKYELDTSLKQNSNIKNNHDLTTSNYQSQKHMETPDKKIFDKKEAPGYFQLSEAENRTGKFMNSTFGYSNTEKSHIKNEDKNPETRNYNYFEPSSLKKKPSDDERLLGTGDKIQKFQFNNTVFVEPKNLPPPSEAKERLSYKYLERVAVNPRVAEIIEKYKKKPETQTDASKNPVEAGPIKIATVKGDGKSPAFLLRSGSSPEGEKSMKNSQETDKLDSNFKGGLKNSGSYDDRVTFGVNLPSNSGNQSGKSYDFFTILDKNGPSEVLSKGKLSDAHEEVQITSFLKKTESLPYESSLPEEMGKVLKEVDNDASLNRQLSDNQEKEVFEEMSSLKGKVISMLLKYQNIINKNKPQSSLQKEIEKDCDLVNKEYSVIMDKYTQLNESYISATRSSNKSLLKPNSKNEQEINNMMDLVQDFLGRFDVQKSLNLSEPKFSATNQSDVSNLNLDKKYKQAKKLLEKSFDTLSSSDISQNERNKYFKMQELKRRSKQEEIQKSFISVSKTLDLSEISMMNTEKSEEAIAKTLKQKPHNTGKMLFYNIDQNNKNLDVFGLKFKKIRPYRFFHERQISSETFNQIDIFCYVCKGYITPLTEFSHRQVCRGVGLFDNNAKKSKDDEIKIAKIFKTMSQVIVTIQSKQYMVLNTQRRKQMTDMLNEVKQIDYSKVKLGQQLTKDASFYREKLNQLQSIISTFTEYDKYTFLFVISLKRLEKIFLEIISLFEGKVNCDEDLLLCPVTSNLKMVVLDDIGSDFEENDLNEEILIRKELESKAKEEEKASKLKQKEEFDLYIEKTKRYFYTEAVNQKMKLPDNHPNRKILISELYDECVKLNTPVEKWRDFLQNRIQIL